MPFLDRFSCMPDDNLVEVETCRRNRRHVCLYITDCTICWSIFNDLFTDVEHVWEMTKITTNTYANMCQVTYCIYFMGICTASVLCVSGFWFNLTSVYKDAVNCQDYIGVGEWITYEALVKCYWWRKWIYSEKHPPHYHFLHHYPIRAGLGSKPDLSGDKPVMFHA